MPSRIPAVCPCSIVIFFTWIIQAGCMWGVDDSRYLDAYRGFLSAFAEGVRSLEFSCIQTQSTSTKKKGQVVPLAQMCHVWMDEKRVRVEMVSDRVAMDGKHEIEKELVVYDGHQGWHLNLQDNIARVSRKADLQSLRWKPPLYIFLGVFHLLRRPENDQDIPFMGNPPLPVPLTRESWHRLNPMGSPNGTVTDLTASSALITAPFQVGDDRYEDRIEILHKNGNPLALCDIVYKRSSISRIDGVSSGDRIFLRVNVGSLREIKLPQGTFPVPEKLTMALDPITIHWNLDRIKVNEIFDEELFIIDPSSAIAVWDNDAQKYVVDHR